MDPPKNGHANITEDEAALYDRQIRLWGMEAQRRMRNASILVFGVRGVGTETIKNLVLAGIGKLIMLDLETVKDEDLGAGFFFDGHDIGKNRAESAMRKVQSLNPLVTVEAIAKGDAMLPGNLEELIKTVDLVIATEMDRAALIALNAKCRGLSKPFYCGANFGLLGYIFCDLIVHEYYTQSKAPSGADKGLPTATKVSYPSLETALLRHDWGGLKKKQTKELSPSVVFNVLAILEFQDVNGRLPKANEGDELLRIKASLIVAGKVNKEGLADTDEDEMDEVAGSAGHELSPVCAMIGGLLAQDVLKWLSGREAPIANFLALDGTTGQATTSRLGI